MAGHNHGGTLYPPIYYPQMSAQRVIPSTSLTHLQRSTLRGSRPRQIQRYVLVPPSPLPRSIPAIAQHPTDMHANRWKYFRWTPRTTWITLVYAVFVPAAFGYVGFVTDVSSCL